MTTYFLDDATGNDADDGLSAPNAWKTWAYTIAHVAAGDLVEVKNTNDYAITVALAFAIGGTVAAGVIRFRGYTTTPGDGGKAVIKTSTNSISLIDMQANDIVLEDIELKHQAGTRGRGITTTAAIRSGITLINCRIEGCTYGIDGEYTTNYTFSGLTLQNCEIVDCATVGVANYATTMVDVLIRGCGDGWRRGAYTSAPAMLCAVRLRVYGSTTYGLRWGTDAAGYISLVDSVVRASGSHGISLNLTSAEMSLLIENTIIYGNGGKGIDTNAKHVAHVLRNVAFRSNTSGNYTSTYIFNTRGEITLTDDPHINAAAYDFGLDPAGDDYVSLKAGGFSGSYGGTGYLDVGGVQHQDAGGGTAGARLVGPSALVTPGGLL